MNRDDIYSVFHGKGSLGGLLRGEATSYVQNIISRKFRGWRSLTVAHSTLCDSILSIVKMRSKEQVVDVNARTVVAAMTHKHPLGDFPILHFPSKSVNKSWIPIDAYDAISSAVNLLRPYSASIFVRSAYSKVKDVPRGNLFTMVVTFFRAIFPLSERYSIGLNKEYFAAYKTQTLHLHNMNTSNRSRTVNNIFLGLTGNAFITN